MTTAVMKYEVLTELLLPLAERFEAGDPDGLKLEASRPEAFWPLRECVAELLEERWLTAGRLSDHYRLTEEGYRHFGPRLHALQTLGDLSAAGFKSADAQKVWPAGQ
ncbi:MAG: hypothetical protein WA369_10940 [Candidatus Acidiferrales bacterium]